MPRMHGGSCCRQVAPAACLPVPSPPFHLLQRFLRQGLQLACAPPKQISGHDLHERPGPNCWCHLSLMYSFMASSHCAWAICNSCWSWQWCNSIKTVLQMQARQCSSFIAICCWLMTFTRSRCFLFSISNLCSNSSTRRL